MYFLIILKEVWGKIIISYGNEFCGGNDVNYNKMNWQEEIIIKKIIEDWVFGEEEYL